MTLDYIAGIGIFLLAVFFVFQFVYGLFIPFQSGSDKATLAADRAATVLVEQMLHADSSVGLNVINQSKLDSFDATNSNTLNALGLNSTQTVFDLNVSVTNLTSANNPNLVYMYNFYSSSTFENSPSANKPMYQSGPPLPTEGTDIGQTKRLVLILNSSTGYKTAILSVRVW